MRTCDILPSYILFHPSLRITYVTQTRFPTEKAHGHQIAQVCAALAAIGHDVMLVAPTVGDAPSIDPFAYYDIAPAFRVLHLENFDALSSPYVPGILSFSLGMRSYRSRLDDFVANHETDLFFIRSPEVLPPLLATGKPVILEVHTLPRFFRRSFRNHCNHCARIVCLTSAQRSAMITMGVDPAKIVVEPDGVDMLRFATLPLPGDAQRQWELPSGIPVVGYVGSLVTRDTIEKGVDILIEAFALLKQRGVRIQGFIVGGPEAWVEKYRRRADELKILDSVIFAGHQPSSTVPSAIAACDVCVFPAPASDHPFFIRDTSPLKVLEYLAAARPVVCADLPPLHDLVDDKIVTFCRPGDADDLARKLADILEHRDEAVRRAEEGKRRMAKHDWKERMKRIIDLLHHP